MDRRLPLASSPLINSEIQLLLDNGFVDSAFLIAVMGIEFLGAMVDSKPVRANGQSSRRFKIGLRKFFPKRYGKPSVTELVYKSLRCNVGHLLQFSSRIDFVEEPASHLRENGLVLQINKRQFVEDYISAIKKLDDRLAEGVYELKKGVV